LLQRCAGNVAMRPATPTAAHLTNDLPGHSQRDYLEGGSGCY
jgi:hypothetical protein